MSTDSPGPLQVLADLVLKISYIKANNVTKILKKSSLIFFVTKLHNMGTVGLLWTRGIKMGHFELTWDTEDPEGMRRSLCLFWSKPYNMGVYGLPWTPAVKI